MPLNRHLSGNALLALLVAVAVELLPRPARAGPKAECVAAATRAQTLRRAGKLVESRDQLLVCARGVCPGAVRSDCTRWLDEVNNSLPTVVLGAKDHAGNDLVQVQVSMDGKPFARAIDGRAVPVDPGAHSFRFAAPGKPVVRRQIVIRQGEKNREIDVTIGAAPAAPAAPAPHGPGSTRAPDRAREESTSTGSSQRAIGAVTGVVGVVGAGIGTVFALRGLSKWNAAKTACPDSTGCRPGSEAYSLNDQANEAGTISAVAFIAGGALLVTGVVIWFTAPHAGTAPAIGASVGPGQVRVVGRF